MLSSRESSGNEGVGEKKKRSSSRTSAGGCVAGLKKVPAEIPRRCYGAFQTSNGKGKKGSGKSTPGIVDACMIFCVH